MATCLTIDVAFTPGEVQALSRKLCVVVDVVLSTSTLAVIMSRRPGKVILTPTVQKATKFASQQNVHPLLCGERGGLPPEGFDHGNSPREFVNADLCGKTLIFTSSNGTRAVADVALAPVVLLGSFLNSSAVVEVALDTARAKTLDIVMVCAGREEKFALDDAYCAGHLVSRLVGGLSRDVPFQLGDGAQAALGIWGYYREPARLLAQSGSGKDIIALGLGEDLEFLQQMDLFMEVPALYSRETSLWNSTFSLLV